MRVNVIHVGQHSRVAWDSIGRRPRQPYRGEIGGKHSDVERQPRFITAALKKEGARLPPARVHIGGTSGRQWEGAWLDARRGVEGHEGVVVHLTVVGGIEDCHLDVVGGSAYGERLQHRRFLEDRAERHLARRRKLRRRCLWGGAKVILGQAESLRPYACE